MEVDLAALLGINGPPKDPLESAWTLREKGHAFSCKQQVSDSPLAGSAGIAIGNHWMRAENNLGVHRKFGS